MTFRGYVVAVSEQLLYLKLQIMPANYDNSNMGSMQIYSGIGVQNYQNTSQFDDVIAETTKVQLFSF